MKNVEDILVRRTLDVMRLFRLRSRYIAVQEKVCAAFEYILNKHQKIVMNLFIFPVSLALLVFCRMLNKVIETIMDLNCDILLAGMLKSYQNIAVIANIKKEM